MWSTWLWLHVGCGVNIRGMWSHYSVSTCTAWIILATSTLVFPFTVFPFTPVISSPAASDPSAAAGVLSKTCNGTYILIRYQWHRMPHILWHIVQKCKLCDHLFYTYLDNVETGTVLGSTPDTNANKVIGIFLQTHSTRYCWYPTFKENGSHF